MNLPEPDKNRPNRVDFEPNLEPKDDKNESDVSTEEVFTFTYETKEIRKKLLAGNAYNQEDITEIAKKLFAESYQEHFKLISETDSVEKALKNVELKPKKPIFVILEKSKSRWILFCIIKAEDDKNLIFFKDSSGTVPFYQLEKQLKKTFTEVEIVVNKQKEQEVDEKHYYGPLCVRNLKILQNLLKEDLKAIAETFPQKVFYQIGDLNNEIVQDATRSVQILGENKEFKEELKTFVNSLPLNLRVSMMEYQKILEEELNKKEEEINHERIKEAKTKLLNEEDVKKLESSYEPKDEKSSEKFELEIQKKFGEEMDELSNILNALDSIKDKKLLDSILDDISKSLDIDSAQMKALYNLKVRNKENEAPNLTPDSIKDIANNLPPLKKPTIVGSYTPLEELLEETILENSSTTNPAEILEHHYYLVKAKNAIWRNKQIEEIHAWANRTKGSLGTKIEDVCEVIAVADRTYCLLSGGDHLRDTQILAVLTFFSGQNRGRLCQIKTGEGKTFIISILAVIKALQGFKVDVITNSPVLATTGVAETRSFYSVFSLTVATNNPNDDKNILKLGYLADVLYGSISNFQFDYLKESFEGLKITSSRGFQQVILDEVDSMLVDNGGNIAKVATPFPGMESLRYVFIKIWQELNKAEESFIQESQKQLEELLKSDLKEDEIKEKYEMLIEEITIKERYIIKEKIKSSNPANIPLIPKHLKNYVDKELEEWINSALQAKYDCHEYQHYRITKNDKGEKVITPVDYFNTGVTLKNTVWSKGLHQFLQIKHNLYLTCGSLTSIFISNIGFIKQYPNIFGVTGTLGSIAEQNLLSSIYNVTFAKIPTYKRKIFEELPGLITDDDTWDVELTSEIIKKVDEERAVLAIFQTEDDLLQVKQNLEILQNNDFRIRVFANEDNVKETQEEVRVGDVILATNLAGRGTDFKTEKKLEKNGGLHVCVSFLPINLRVEEQAFGRTSRQGNKGTAHLVIRRSEVEKLSIHYPNPSFTEIKYERDYKERDRIKTIKEVTVKEINFKEELVQLFSYFYLSLKVAKISKRYVYILQDLKEFWAFWLDRKHYNINNIKGTTPQKEFEQFVTEAETIVGGVINHNPFYSIELADYYMEKNSNSKARMELIHAISMDTQHPELMAGAYLKLFELAIVGGGQTMQKIKKAIAKVFFINVKKNESYKNKAVSRLNEAKTAIDTEINYIQTYLTDQNEDFQNILQQNQDENLFLKHIYSRLYCLNIHTGNIENLIKEIESTSQGIDFAGKAPTSLENLKKMSNDSDSVKTVTNNELLEIQEIGIDAIYSLRKVSDVPDAIIYAAQGQIGAGIAALASGLIFPPILPIMGPLGATLITEAIVDIVMSLFEDHSEFDQADFIKGKAVSYGITLVTFGLTAIAQSVKIITKAVNFCRKLSSFLQKSKYLKVLTNNLAKVVDKIGNVLEKSLALTKFNKLTKTEQLNKLKELRNSGKLEAFEHLGGLNKLTKLQKLEKIGKLRELTRSQLLVKFAKKIAWDTTKKITKSLSVKYVVKPFFSKVFEQFIDFLKAQFTNLLKTSIREKRTLLEKLKTAPIEEIDEAVKAFEEKSEAWEKLEEFAYERIGKFKNSTVDFTVQTFKSGKNVKEIIHICKDFASYLDEHLEVGTSNNNVDEVIDKICTKPVDKLLSLCWDLLKENTKFAWENRKLFISSKEKPSAIVVSLSQHSSSKKRAKDSSYKIFGLGPGATKSKVISHYRKMALRLHPDRNLNDPSATERFQEFGEAYEDILKTFDDNNGGRNGVTKKGSVSQF